MPIDRDNLIGELSSKVVSINNLQKPKKIYKNCGSISKQFEKFFKYSLIGKLEKLNELNLIELFEEFAYQIHGYHILDIVAAGVDPKIDFIGVSPPISVKNLRNVNHYIDNELEKEHLFIEKHLKRIQPDIVNISGSETIDDNMLFFESNGINRKIASDYSFKIFSKWEHFWMKIIKRHSKTKFIVSAGNGGRDWKSDLIGSKAKAEHITTPANINLPNVIVVGSKNQNKLSPFSNFGKIVDAYENGEQLAARIPCKAHQSLLLTGTSQSTAIHTNKLLKN